MLLPWFPSQSPPLQVAPNTLVSPLGFGTWSWGNTLLWGYDKEQDESLRAAVAEVQRRGGAQNFFYDTGDSYGTGALEGRAETLLGTFRRESRSPKRVVVGTKLAVYPTRLTGRSFEDACRASLKRMELEQIDLVQAHWSAANLQPWQEPALWDGLARCYEQGLARAVGTSNFGPKQLCKVNDYWCERGVLHTTNQVQFSLLSQLPLKSGVLDVCKERGITPIGYSPLCLGLLSGKYSEKNVPKGPRGLLFRQLLPQLRPLLGALEEIAAARGKTCSQVAINWCISKGVLVIVGIRNPQQAIDNLGCLGWRLSAAEVIELEAIAARLPVKATQNVFQTA